MAKKDTAGNGDVKTLLSKLKKLSPTPANIRQLAGEYREITDPSVRDAVVDFLFFNSKKNDWDKWRSDCFDVVCDVWGKDFPEDVLQKVVEKIHPLVLFRTAGHSMPWWLGDKIRERPALQEGLIRNAERHILERRKEMDTLEAEGDRETREYHFNLRLLYREMEQVQLFLHHFPEADEEKRVRCLELMRDNCPEEYCLAMRFLWNDMSEAVQENFLAFAKEYGAKTPRFGGQDERDGIILFLSGDGSLPYGTYFDEKRGTPGEAAMIRMIKIWLGREKVNLSDMLELLVSYNFPDDLKVRVSARLMKEPDKVFAAPNINCNYLIRGLSKLPEDHQNFWLRRHLGEMDRKTRQYDDDSSPLNEWERYVLRNEAREKCIDFISSTACDCKVIARNLDAFLPFLQHAREDRRVVKEYYKTPINRFSAVLASTRILTEREREKMFGPKNEHLEDVLTVLVEEIEHPDMFILMKNVTEAIQRKKSVDLPIDVSQKLLYHVKDAAAEGNAETLDLAKLFIAKVCGKVLENAGEKERDSLLNLFNSLENERSTPHTENIEAMIL